MAKRFVLIILLLAPFMMRAGTVSPERAQKIAGNLLSSQGCWSKVITLVQNPAILTKAESNDPAYYIFKGNSGGFVIMSADDRMPPIIGWSASNDFAEDAIPENLQAWLGLWDSALTKIRSGRQAPQMGARQEWEAFEQGRFPLYATEKQYETAKWGQESPFNRYCPAVDGKPCAAGCVAVATSILMHYHKWPEAGTGDIPEYYYQDDDGTARKVNALSLGNAYDWESMPMELHDYDDDEQAKEQVARLIADVGITIQSHYNPGGTGAYTSDVVDQLPLHFFYDASMVEYYQTYYTHDEWTEMLRKGLDSCGPLIYSGSSARNGGHAFVVDGYNAKGQFSINWGWAGRSNGFFTFPDFDDFKLYNSALFNIKKDEGGSFVEVLCIDSTSIGRGLTSETDEFKVGEPFTISCHTVFNLSTRTFTGTFALAVVHRDGTMGEMLDDGEGEEDDVFTIEPMYGASLISEDCVLTEQPQIGDRIRLFFRSENTPEWTFVPGNKEDGISDEILIADAQRLDEVTSFNYTSATGKLVINTKKDAQWSVIDVSGTSYSDGISFDNGSLTIDTKQFPLGSYSISLSKGDIDSMSVEFVFGSK